MKFQKTKQTHTVENEKRWVSLDFFPTQRFQDPLKLLVCQGFFHIHRSTQPTSHRCLYVFLRVHYQSKTHIKIGTHLKIGREMGRNRPKFSITDNY